MYDLHPRNKDLDSFYLGAFSFPILLEACGYLFPCVQNGPKWYCVFGIDERMPKGDSYPGLISNDGFRVTAEEARIMARVARNFVAVQRSLSDEHTPPPIDPGLSEWEMERRRRWPGKIREDFVNKFEQFADWAEKSRGFRIC